MTQGDIVLIEMLQQNGKRKRRPALILKVILPFQDCLICGISSQLHQEVKGLDFVLKKENPAFKDSGLKTDSLFRLGFLTTISRNRIPGKIGSIPVEMQEELLLRLTGLLNEPVAP